MKNNPKHNKVNPSGLRLDAPSLDAPSPSAAAQFFFSFPLLFSGVFSAVWCFLSAFEVSVFWGWLAACTFLVAALTSFLLIQRHKMTYLLSLALLWTILVILSRDHFVQGFIRTVNDVSRSYSKAANMHLTLFVVPTVTPETAVMQVTLFCVLFLILLILLFGWLLLCQHWHFVCFVVTIPFLAVPLTYTIVPDYKACGLLLAFWACLLLTHRGMGRKHGFHKRRNGYVASGMNGGRAAVFLYPSLAALLFLLFLAAPPQSYTRPQALDNLREAILDSVANLSKAGTGPVGSSNDRVELQNLDELEYEGTEVLQVSSDLVAPLYLKSFVGSIYTGSSWERAKEEDFLSISGQDTRYNPQNFAYYSNRLTILHTPGTLSVRNVGGNPQCIYSPYSLADLPGSNPDFQFVQDGFLESKKPFGTSEYSMNISTMNPKPENRIIQFGAAIADEIESIDPSWLDGLNFSYNRVPDIYFETIPEEALTILRPDVADFFREEQAYSKYVYEHYRQLPDNLRGKLEQYCEMRGFSSSLTLQEQVQVIAKDIIQSGSYTLSPPKTPKGRDFVDYFLFESKKGYCVHFASAAVAVFRAQGIPARYAEGYTVSPDDFTNAQNGWVSVRDYRAHAWVEVYYPGYGWAPVDVTPGYTNGHTPAEEAANSSSMPESSLPSSSEPESSAPSSSEAPLSSSPPMAESSASVPAQETNFQPVLTALLMIAAGFALLLLLLLIRRQIHIRMRKKQFSQSDHNKAALAVYRYIQRLIRAASPTLELTGEMPKDLEELVLRARFSQHKLQAEDVKRLTQYADLLCSKMKAKLSPLGRIWFAYLLGLS